MKNRLNYFFILVIIFWTIAPNLPIYAQVDDSTDTLSEELLDETLVETALDDAETELEAFEIEEDSAVVEENSTEELLTSEEEEIVSNSSLESSESLTMHFEDTILIIDASPSAEPRIIDNTTTSVVGGVDYVAIENQIPDEVDFILEQITGEIGGQPFEVYANGQLIATTKFSGTLFYRLNFDQPFRAGTVLTFKVPEIIINDQYRIQVAEYSVTVAGEVEEELAFLTYPVDFSFDPILFNYQSRFVTTNQASAFEFQILDSRQVSGWQLNAKLISDLTNEYGHSIATDLAFDGQTISAEEVQIASSNGVSSYGNVSTIVIGAESGFQLTVDSAEVQANTDYSMDIHWNLVDGPG